MKNFFFFFSLLFIAFKNLYSSRISEQLNLFTRSKLKTRKKDQTIDYQDNTPDDWYMIENGEITSSSHEPGFPPEKVILDLKRQMELLSGKVMMEQIPT